MQRVALLLFLVVVLGATLLVAARRPATSTFERPTSTSTAHRTVVSQSPTAAALQGSGRWIHYHNDFLNIGFDYPDDWVLNDEPYGTDIIIEHDPPSRGGTSPLPSDHAGISIEHLPSITPQCITSSTRSYEGYLQSLHDCFWEPSPYYDVTTSTTSLAGVPALLFDGFDSPDGTDPSERIVVPWHAADTSSTRYVYEFVVEYNRVDYSPVLRRLVSTLTVGRRLPSY